MASIITTFRDVERLRQIIAVLARHGFSEVLVRAGVADRAPPEAAVSVPPKPGSQAPARTFAQRIRAAITDLGPSFVKLGQILSTRPDLLPEDVIAELKTLQDQVPPLSYADVRDAVEESLGARIGDTFESFDETPLASASIGQVHRAKLRRGEELHEVVVKVQRPKIQDTIARDIDLLYWLARAVERSIPESKVYSPVKLVAEFERAINAELDFALEADHAQRFARNFEGRADARFPVVFRELSTRRVLVLEYFAGAKIYDAVANGASAEKIAKGALGVLVKMIFEDGFFHADPHPGNVIILGTDDAPVLGMIDLGLVGRLTPSLRDKSVDLMVAVAREDKRAIADALLALGRSPAKIDRDAFEAHVSALSDRYLGRPLREIEVAALIRDLVQGATKFGLEIPADFLLVGKAIMTIEGVGKEIYPDLDVFGELRPYFATIFWQRYSPEKLTEDALRNLTRLGNATADMPLQIQDILDELRRGNLSVKIDTPIADTTERLGRRLFSGLVVAAAIIGGGMCIATNHTLEGYLFLGCGVGWGTAHATGLFVRARFSPRA